MPRQPSFAHFDAAVAERFVAASAEATGLPGYLAIRFVEMTAGRLVAMLTVRDEFLTPFKTLHGGGMAGLVPPVLGGVLYPPVPRRAWAPPPGVLAQHPAPRFARAERVAAPQVR